MTQEETPVQVIKIELLRENHQYYYGRCNNGIREQDRHPVTQAHVLDILDAYEIPLPHYSFKNWRWEKEIELKPLP